MLRYIGWVKPSQVHPLKAWLFHKWSEWQPYYKGCEWDGLRLLGFEWEHLILKIHSGLWKRLTKS